MKASRQTTLSLVIIVAVVLSTGVVLLVGGGSEPKGPGALPTELPRETFLLPKQGKVKNAPSYSPGAVVARIITLEGTCWSGDINSGPIEGCGAREYVVVGPPGVGNLYSVTLRKDERNRDRLKLELVINGEVVSTDQTKQALDVIAVSGN